MTIRVFLADDHRIVLHGLRQLIDATPGMAVVGEASDGLGVLGAAEREDWDVLVLDLSLPKLDGVEIVRRILAIRPRAQIVVFTMYPEDQLAAHLLREGVAAYLSKTRAPEELLSAIRRAAAGGRYVTPELAEHVIESSRPGVKGAPHHSLSAREYQVFTLLYQGKTVGQIAAELGLTSSTVSNHVMKIKQKLSAQSVGEIVNYAHRAGLTGVLPE